MGAHKCVCQAGTCNIGGVCQCKESGTCAFGECSCPSGYCLDETAGTCYNPYAMADESKMSTGKMEAMMAAVPMKKIGETKTMPTKPMKNTTAYTLQKSDSSSCSKDTGGSCRMFSCHASRGPTDCTAHKC